jgi:hypothetical protein
VAEHLSSKWEGLDLIPTTRKKEKKNPKEQVGALSDPWFQDYYNNFLTGREAMVPPSQA